MFQEKNRQQSLTSNWALKVQNPTCIKIEDTENTEKLVSVDVHLHEDLSGD